jgi:hypothetical protein
MTLRKHEKFMFFFGIFFEYRDLLGSLCQSSPLADRHHWQFVAIYLQNSTDISMKFPTIFPRH